MNPIRNALFVLAALSPLAMAQVTTSGPVAATAGPWGVFAANGASTNYDAKAAQTAVGRGLSVRAAVGGSATTRPDALATSGVVPVVSTTGTGFRFTETGALNGTVAGTTLSVGSSSSAVGSQNPAAGAHGVAIRYAVPQGSSASVVIAWAGRASTGATLGASIDLNGDGTPEWSANNGTAQTVSLPVTAGANGITIAVLTGGSASLTGIGTENYSSNLTVSLRAPQTGVTVTWASSGPQCLGALAGSDTQANGMLTLTLGVTGAARTGFGVMVLGQPAATPTALPFGSCQLLLDTTGGLSSFATDANGDATVTLRARAVPFTMSFQAVTFGFDALGQSALGSTNVQGLTCQ